MQRMAKLVEHRRHFIEGQKRRFIGRNRLGDVQVVSYHGFAAHQF